MLMVRSLAERLHTLEQQKARLAEQEAKLRLASRKARMHRLIQAGGLIDKAGLLDLEPNALYGALLSLRESANTSKQVEQWAVRGGRAFAREAKADAEGRAPIVLAFPASLDKDATTALRAAGFRFNKVLQHWEGLVRLADAKALASAHGGKLRPITPNAATDGSAALSAAALDTAAE